MYGQISISTPKRRTASVKNWHSGRWKKQKNKRDSLAYTEEVSKWRIHPMELIVFVLLIISPLFIVSKPWNYLMAIIIFLCCLIYIWNRMKVSKRKEKQSRRFYLKRSDRKKKKHPERNCSGNRTA